jgi:hypothetical protein
MVVWHSCLNQCCSVLGSLVLSVFLVLIEPLVQILDQFFKLAQYHELATTGLNLSCGILGLVQFSRGVMSGNFSLSQIS